jgi:hypothetical protein
MRMPIRVGTDVLVYVGSKPGFTVLVLDELRVGEVLVFVLCELHL